MRQGLGRKLIQTEKKEDAETKRLGSKTKNEKNKVKSQDYTWWKKGNTKKGGG